MKDNALQAACFLSQHRCWWGKGEAHNKQKATPPMKSNWLKALLVGFSIVIAGAAWAQDQPQVGYGDVTFNLENSSPIFVVSGLPMPSDSATISNVHLGDIDYEIYTDGSGKIAGFAMMNLIVTNWVGGNPVATFTTNVLKVTGSLKTVGTNATVRLSLSGSGIAVRGTNYGRSKLTYKFTGSRNVANQLAGNLSGSFKPGIAGLASTSFQDVPARISSYSSGSEIHDCNFELAYADTQMFVEGCLYAPIHGYYAGGGKSAADGSFSIKVSGYDEARGTKFTILGVATPDGDDSVWSPVSATGKAYGQRIDATGSGYFSRYFDDL